MRVTVIPAPNRRLARCVLFATLLLLAAGTHASAEAAGNQVSSNWAGHVAALRHGRGHAFLSVSGTWVVPTATCSEGNQGYSAVWVGLGGYDENASGLEQAGTEQDCNRRGAATYAAWFEILPAGAVKIDMHVHPGDTVSVSTTVAGHWVTFHFRDLTTGARFSTTRHASATDVSTAEWIVEAPSSCSASGACSALPLARISPVQFASATAISGTRSRPAGEATWSNTTIELKQASVSLPTNPEVQTGPEETVVSAIPSPAVLPYGAFSVSLAEQTSQVPLPSRPTLPGFGPR